MSFFNSFGGKGFASLTETLENLGNMVAPIDEDKEETDFLDGDAAVDLGEADQISDQHTSSDGRSDHDERVRDGTKHAEVDNSIQDFFNSFREKMHFKEATDGGEYEGEYEGDDDGEEQEQPTSGNSDVDNSIQDFFKSVRETIRYEASPPKVPREGSKIKAASLPSRDALKDSSKSSSHQNPEWPTMGEGGIQSFFQNVKESILTAEAPTEIDSVLIPTPTITASYSGSRTRANRPPIPQIHSTPKHTGGTSTFSTPELEKKVQQKYREQLEAELSNMEARHREQQSAAEERYAALQAQRDEWQMIAHHLESADNGNISTSPSSGGGGGTEGPTSADTSSPSIVARIQDLQNQNRTLQAVLEQRDTEIHRLRTAAATPTVAVPSTSLSQSSSIAGSSLEQRLQQTMQELEAAHAECEREKGIAAKHVGDLNDLNELVRAAGRRIEQLQQENEMLLQQMTVLNEQADKHQEQQHQGAASTANGDTDTSTMEEQLSDALSEVASLKQHIEQLQADHDKSTTAATNALAQVTVLKEDIVHTRKELEASQVALDEALTASADAKGALHQQQQFHAQKSAHLEEELSSVQEERARLEQQCMALEEEVASLRGEVQQLRQQSTEQEQEQQRKEHLLEQQQVEQAEQARLLIEQIKQEAEERRKALTEEMQNAERAAREQVQQLESGRAALAEELKAILADREAMSQQLQQCQKRTEDLQQSMDSALNATQSASAADPAADVSTHRNGDNDDGDDDDEAAAAIAAQELESLKCRVRELEESNAKLQETCSAQQAAEMELETRVQRQSTALSSIYSSLVSAQHASMQSAESTRIIPSSDGGQQEHSYQSYVVLIGEMGNELASNTAQIQQLRKLIEDHSATMDATRNELGSLQAQKQQLQEELNQALGDLEQAGEQHAIAMEESRAECARLAAEFEQQQHVKHVQDELIQTRQQYVATRNELGSLQAQKQQLQEELNQALSDLEQAGEQHAIAMEESRAECARLAAEFEQQQQVQHVQNELMETQKQLTLTEQELNVAQEEITRKNATVNSLQGDVTALTGQLENLQQLLADTEGELESARTQARALKEQCTQLQQLQGEQESQQVAQLRTQLQEKDDQFAATCSQLEAVQQEKSSLTATVQGLEEQLEKDASAREESQVELGKLRDQSQQDVTALTGQLDNLQQLLADTEGELESARTQARALKEQCTQLQQLQGEQESQQVAQLRTQLEEKDAAIVKFDQEQTAQQEAVAKTEVALAEVVRAKNSLAANLAEANSTLSELRSECERATEESTRLEAALKECEDALKNMEEVAWKAKAEAAELLFALEQEQKTHQTSAAAASEAAAKAATSAAQREEELQVIKSELNAALSAVSAASEEAAAREASSAAAAREGALTAKQQVWEGLERIKERISHVVDTFRFLDTKLLVSARMPNRTGANASATSTDYDGDDLQLLTCEVCVTASGLSQLSDCVERSYKALQSQNEFMQASLGAALKSLGLSLKDTEDVAGKLQQVERLLQDSRHVNPVPLGEEADSGGGCGVGGPREHRNISKPEAVPVVAPEQSSLIVDHAAWLRQRCAQISAPVQVHIHARTPILVYYLVALNSNPAAVLAV